MADTLILIDGNSLLNRAFYAIPALNARDGTPINAVYGFVNMLLKLIDTLKPRYIGAVFDRREPTFRHKRYEGYKATRKPMPDDLAVQLPLLDELLAAMGIARLSMAGYEADDVIGTIATKESVETVIVTGDRDSFQLISPTTRVHFTKRGITDVAVMDEKAFRDEYGFDPPHMVDLKALMGDTSDNIPGVPGIGEKTAMRLMADYGSLQNVYAHLDEIAGAARNRLAEGRASADLSYDLATIDRNVPIAYTLDDLRYPFPFPAEVRRLFERFGFKSLLQRAIFADEAPAPVAVSVKRRDLGLAQLSALDLAHGYALYDDEDGVHLATDDKTDYRIRTGGDLLDHGATFEETVAALPFLADPDVPKTVFDGKALRHRIAAVGGDLVGVTIDVQLARYVTDCVKPNATLADILSDYGLDGYADAPAAGLARLAAIQTKELEPFRNIYYGIELPLSDVLYKMERRGWLVDTAVLDRIGTELSGEIDAVTARIYACAGHPFNINSPKQIGDVLFGELGLETGRKTKKQTYSTNAEVLEWLRDKHPIVEEILRYRQLYKLYATYIEGLEKLLGPDHVVHTVFKQTVAQTGRLSSVEPNLQNIPVREEEGKRLRKMFVAREGCDLVSADYSQIELRLLAHLSGEPALIEAYGRGEDIHTQTACLVFGVSPSEVTPAMRREAKAVNFGVIYGISDFGLAKNTGVSVPRARKYIAEYFLRYPRVKAYLDGCVQAAHRDRKLATPLGRVRRFDNINSSNFQARSFSERAAMNMPLQAMAADLIKIAMIEVDRAFAACGMRAQLICQVHDELIVECPTAETAAVRAILHDKMEHAMTLSVPLVVEVSDGKTWFDLK